MWYQDTKLDDAHEFSVYTFEPQLRAFARVVWPVFARVLLDELKAEAAPTP